MGKSSESRKSTVATRLILPTNGRTLLRRPRGANASNLPRRRFLHIAAGAAALPAISRDASAQSYPLRPITMIVPIAAGSSSDTVGRLVAERMGRALGQSIIVENVSGADGTIGVGRVARARADGYTIELGSQTANVLNGAFYSLSYDLLGELMAPRSVSGHCGGSAKTVTFLQLIGPLSRDNHERNRVPGLQKEIQLMNDPRVPLQRRDGGGTAMTACESTCPRGSYWSQPAIVRCFRAHGHGQCIVAAANQSAAPAADRNAVARCARLCEARDGFPW